jgi:hypothetical protein
MTQNGGKGPMTQTTMPNGQVVTSYPYDPALKNAPSTTMNGSGQVDISAQDKGYDTNKTPGQNLSAGLSYISPDFVNNLVGGGASDVAAKQTALAQATVAPSNQQAADIYGAAMNQAASANAIQRPGAVAAPVMTSATINPNAYNVNTNTAAQVDDATLRMKAYQAAQAQASDAAIQNVKEANVSRVAAVPGADVAKVNTTINAPTIGDAAQTGGVTVGSTQLGPEATALQKQELQAASAIANGPSAAMSQFQAGQSQVVKDQLAMAAASRGSERAGARREAMINAGASGAQNNLAAASLAAQETQAKNVAASSAYQGIGAQALAAATTQAQITSQQQQLQAQLDSAIAQGNTAAINSIKTQQAQLGLQAQTSTVQAGLNQQGTLANVAQSNTALQQQTAMANAAAANTSAANYAASQNAAYSQLAANQTGTSQANAAATNAAAAYNTGAYNTAAQTAASQQSATNLANAALAQQQAQANANRAAGIDTTNATQQNAVSGANASNSIAAQTTNAANQLNTSQLQQTGATAALNAGNTAVGNEAKNAVTVVDANKATAADATSTDAANKGMLAAGIAKLSDERAKEDVQKLSPYDTRHWAESIDPITFRYKEGHEDDGKDVQLGVSAQQVEKSGPLGRLMVHQDPGDDLKHVDYGALTLMLSKTALDVADEALERSKGKQARRAAR